MSEDVGMENDSAGHIHMWQRHGGSCLCGEPVPAYLANAWNRYAEKAADGTGP